MGFLIPRLQYLIAGPPQEEKVPNQGMDLGNFRNVI